MEALECIKTRRSVRKFTEEAVSREQMAEVVAAAAYAPSWKNTQTARYNFVTDKEKIARLASDCMMDFAYNQKTASHAPALVILTTITGRSGFERDGSFSTSKGTHWQSFDAGIAAEAFCLAAHAYGLGTVIMGAIDTVAVAETVGLDSTRTVSCMIAVGYPDQQPLMPKRKTVDELLS